MSHKPYIGKLYTLPGWHDEVVVHDINPQSWRQLTVLKAYDSFMVFHRPDNKNVLYVCCRGGIGWVQRARLSDFVWM